MTVKFAKVEPVLIITLGRRNLYATRQFLRWGTRGKMQTASEVITELDKGEARQVRKALFRKGFRAHAAALRRPCKLCEKRTAIKGDFCVPCDKKVPF